MESREIPFERQLLLFAGIFYLLGAYIAHWLSIAGPLGDATILVYVSTVAAVGGLGAIFYFGLLRWHVADVNRTMLLCLATNFAVAEFLRTVAGGRAILVPSVVSGSASIGSFQVGWQQLLIIPEAALVVCAVAIIVHRTALGRSIRQREINAPAMLEVFYLAHQLSSLADTHLPRRLARWLNVDGPARLRSSCQP